MKSAPAPIHDRSMKTHEFVVTLLGRPELDRQTTDRLFEAGCDDATLVERNGARRLVFARQAETLSDAVLSALANIRAAGLRCVVTPP
jgi:hypothetical protein